MCDVYSFGTKLSIISLNDYPVRSTATDSSHFSCELCTVYHGHL